MTDIHAAPADDNRLRLDDLRLRLDDLADVNTWVAWREEERRGRMTKMPYNPRDGGPELASIPTNPETWGTLEQAQARWSRINNGGKGGVGLVLGEIDPDTIVLGIVLDNCRGPDRFTRKWATEIIERFNLYRGVAVGQRHQTVLPRQAGRMGEGQGTVRQETERRAAPEP